MKHLIIGAGTVGMATGIWLEANKEEVFFFDADKTVNANLRKLGHKIEDTPYLSEYDMYWICTHEKNVEEVLKHFTENTSLSTLITRRIVIRSSMPPGETKKLCSSYNVVHYAHFPEFLREKTAIEDVFSPDRIIIGTYSNSMFKNIASLFFIPGVPIIQVSPLESELIKLISNNWLSTQISFWNEIHMLLKKNELNAQKIVNAVTLDKRISKYGTRMTGNPFEGMCLPKDLNTLLKYFEECGLKATVLESIKRRNENEKE